MRIMWSDSTPGYPTSGGSAAFTAGGNAWVKAAHEQRGRLNCVVVGPRVQTLIADVPGNMSALSSVRRT